MKERDCANCKHHTEDGCSSWDCEFEAKDLISRADAIEAVKDTILKRFNLADWYEEMLNCGVEIEDRIKALPSAEAEAVQGDECDHCVYKWGTKGGEEE